MPGVQGGTWPHGLRTGVGRAPASPPEERAAALSGDVPVHPPRRGAARLTVAKGVASMLVEMNRRSGQIGGRRLLVGIGGFSLAAGLTVFHGGLLWQRLTDGSLLQPIVVARWAVSVLLVAGLLQLWSKGLPVLRGRRAGVLWLIVVLLHAFTPGGALPAVVPVAGMLPAALALFVCLAFGLIAAPGRGSSAVRPSVLRRRERPLRSSAGWYQVLFSRPPPVLLHP